MDRPHRMAPALAAAVLALPAHAQGNAELADQLGMVLGSADICDLELDEDAILAVINDRVDASDLAFAADLDTETRYQAIIAGRWSGISRIAQCRAVENSARANGLMD